MYERKITYTDYDGNKRTESFFFNLTKAEVIEWLTASGSVTLDKVLIQLTEKNNAGEILQTFKDLVYRAYGEKSLDGRRFVKSPEVKANFMETEAYSVLFTELAFDAKKAADFLNRIIPPDLADDISKVMKDRPEEIEVVANAIGVSTEELSQTLSPADTAVVEKKH